VQFFEMLVEDGPLVAEQRQQAPAEVVSLGVV
jgi:hypothetical protein